jgi:GntR family transcriptional repressor for pyruvate dehydrogenase complex
VTTPPGGSPIGLPALRRERLMDRAVDAMKQHIIVNGLQAGDRLPSEPELARSLGVSRNIVRQAISSLEAVGIVRSEHGRGTFIAEMGASSNVLEHLDFWLDIDNLSQQEYAEARWAFDAGVLQLVMRNATGEDFEHLERVLLRMEGCSLDDVPRHHDAFHLALLEATHNRFLASFTIILYRFFWRLAAGAPQVRRVPRDEQVRSHRELFEGLRRRNEVEIPELVTVHLRQ